MALIVLIILAAIVTGIGVAISPFWIYSVLHVILCIIFACRRIGIIVPSTKMRTAEITGDVLITALAWFLHKLTWGNLLLVIGLRVLYLLIIFYDDKHYLYIEEDI